jgi:hypothetical protein
MLPEQNNLRDKVHKRIRIRLIIYFVVSILVLAISIFHIVKDNANWLAALVGLVIGFFLGLIVSRAFKLSWNEKAAQITSSFDAIGITLLVLYILFEIFRNKIVANFVSGPSVIAVSFAVLSGVMYGRVIGTRGKIRRIFREEGITE